jgi:hypothetical protein
MPRWRLEEAPSFIGDEHLVNSFLLFHILCCFFPHERTWPGHRTNISQHPLDLTVCTRLSALSERAQTSQTSPCKNTIIDEDGHGAERRRRKSRHIDDKGERSTLTTCPADAHLAPHWIHSAILEAPDPAILHNSTLNLAPSVTPILASPRSTTAEAEAMLERFTCLAT